MSIKNAKISNTFIEEKSSPISDLGPGITPVNPEIEQMFCKIAIDYLSFTIPFNSINRIDYEKTLKLLMLDEFKGEISQYGRYNYMMSTKWLNELDQEKRTFTHFYSGGNSSINNKYGEPTGMFELEGDGCRALEKRGGESFPGYWKTVFQTLLFGLRHCSVTRFDFAIDVFNASFTLDELEQALIKRNVVTPFQKYRREKDEYVKSEEVDLYILRLGSRDSDLHLCIYDKKEERESIGREVKFKSWYRFEFRFKHVKAKSMMLNILDNFENPEAIANYAAELILKYCDVKDRPTKGKNCVEEKIVSNDVMRKWKTNQKWLDFVGVTTKAKIENYFKYESSITKLANWFSRSVSKGVAKLFFANPNLFYAFVYKAILEGATRMKKADKAYVDDYRRNKHDKELTGQEMDALLNKIELNLSQYLEDNDINLYDYDENGVVNIHGGDYYD